MASNIRRIPTGAKLDPITADITFTQAVYASWAIPMNFKLEYYDTNLVLKTLNATLNTIGGTVTKRVTFAYKTYMHFYSYGGSFNGIKAVSGTIKKVYSYKTTGDGSYDYDFYIICT